MQHTVSSGAALHWENRQAFQNSCEKALETRLDEVSLTPTDNLKHLTVFQRSRSQRLARLG